MVTVTPPKDDRGDPAANGIYGDQERKICQVQGERLRLTQCVTMACGKLYALRVCSERGWQGLAAAFGT